VFKLFDVRARIASDLTSLGFDEILADRDFSRIYETDVGFVPALIRVRETTDAYGTKYVLTARCIRGGRDVGAGITDFVRSIADLPALDRFVDEVECAAHNRSYAHFFFSQRKKEE
jgi:hypothetical protein